MDGIQAAFSLMLKALLLSARCLGTVRIRQMKNLVGEKNNLAIEIQFLRDLIFQLKTELEFCRIHGKDTNRKPCYTLRERLLILWYKEYFQVSIRKITNWLGVARSTIYRWMRQIEDASSEKTEPANKTPIELVRLVWSVTKSNPHWGRIRISLQLSLLQVFVAASTVRNILNRPKPSPQGSKKTKINNPQDCSFYRSIPALYPNESGA